MHFNIFSVSCCSTCKCWGLLILKSFLIVMLKLKIVEFLWWI